MNFTSCLICDVVFLDNSMGFKMFFFLPKEVGDVFPTHKDIWKTKNHQLWIHGFLWTGIIENYRPMPL